MGLDMHLYKRVYIGNQHTKNKNEQLTISLPENQDERFFFGSTEYSELYVRMLEDTIQKLEPAIGSEHDFYYASSW